MQQINIRGASVEMLQVEMGLVLANYIDQWGDKSDFAREAGINRATLYRLLRGNNVGTDTLLRVLRTLGRHDVLFMLLEPVTESPIEKLQKYQGHSLARKRSTQVQPESVAETPVFGELKLGIKKPANNDA